TESDPFREGHSMSKTPAAATKVGSNCYLFKSITNSVDCLISAHGGFMAENRSFTVPDGVTIRFYVEHGASLCDPGVVKFATFSLLSKAVVNEEFTGGESCRGYLLSKYQGAHAGESGTETVETYNQVHDAVTSPDTLRQMKANRYLRELANGQDELAAA